MPITDLVVSTAILDHCESLTKAEVVYQLLLRLAAVRHLEEASVPSVLDAVMRRESMASTGIGAGIAIPHAKHAAVTHRLGIIGLCRPPVDFDSIDAEPADLILLILWPPDSPGYQSMRVPREMESLNRRLQSAEFCARLRQSTTAEDLWKNFSQSDLND